MSSISEQLSSYGRSTGPRAKGFRLGATIDTSRLSALGCGSKCCKYSLMGLSIFLVCCGIGVLIGGAYSLNSDTVVSVIGTSFVNLIIGFGVVVGFIGVVGLVGSKLESRRVLSLYLLMMCLISIAILIIGAWALSNLGKEGTILSSAWQKLDSDEKLAIENHYTCCGAYYWGEATDSSACPCTKSECAGCFPQLITAFRSLYTAFGVIFIILGCIMFSTIVTAYFLMKGIAGVEKAKKGGKKKKGRG